MYRYIAVKISSLRVLEQINKATIITQREINLLLV